MRERGWILRMEDKMLGIFVGQDGPEIFTGKEIDLVEELFQVSVKSPVAIEYKLSCY
jgi:hypothetical protein